MAKKRRFFLERASWHDARFGNGTPVEIKSTMLEHSNGQPGISRCTRRITTVSAGRTAGTVSSFIDHTAAPGVRF